MKRLLNILLLLAVSISLMAAEVTGKVIDFESKKPIDFANVSAMQGEQLITGVVTDEAGGFALELKEETEQAQGQEQESLKY